MLSLAEAALQKLRAHLWYLSERVVILSLFCPATDPKDLKEMAKGLLKCKDKQASTSQDMPSTKKFASVQLKSFVGPDSWTFFELSGVEPTFLSKPVAEWAADESYDKLSTLAKSIKVINDSAERALGMLTEYHLNKITKNEEQRQHLLQCVKEMRKRQKGLLKDGKGERCNKKIMQAMSYD